MAKAPEAIPVEIAGSEASKVESMSLTAKEEGYTDSNAYWREQLYGKPRPQKQGLTNQ